MAVASRDAGHLREQVDRCRVKPELGLVQDHRRGKVRPQQQGGQADETQRAIAGLTCQEGAVQAPLLPTQPDSFRGIGSENEIVEERRDAPDGSHDPLVVPGVFPADPVKVGGDVLRIGTQGQVVADRRPSLHGRVTGDVVEVENATTLQDGTHVPGEVRQFPGILRLGDVTNPAPGTETQVLLVRAVPLVSRLEEQPFVQLRQTRTGHLVGAERHPVTIPGVPLIEPGHEGDENAIRPGLFTLEEEIVHAPAAAQVLLEGVIPDARHQLQGADEIRLARSVGPDEHRDVGAQVQFDVSNRSQPLHDKVSQRGSHATGLGHAADASVTSPGNTGRRRGLPEWGGRPRRRLGSDCRKTSQFAVPRVTFSSRVSLPRSTFRVTSFPTS